MSWCRGVCLDSFVLIWLKLTNDGKLIDQKSIGFNRRSLVKTSKAVIAGEGRRQEKAILSRIIQNFHIFKKVLLLSIK